ncbi:MAG: cation:dicarboxylase symporter family transporter, partial [bacterium]
CSSLASIPIALKTLQDEMKLNKLATELVLPLGATIGPQANIFFFAFVSFFVARIYGLDIGFNELAIIMTASFFQSIAGVGLPVMASLTMMSLLLGPIGIPTETVLVLFWAIIPVLDPFETVINVSGYCAVAVVVDKTGDPDNLE